jgi:hypothetical protein
VPGRIPSSPYRSERFAVTRVLARAALALCVALLTIPAAPHAADAALNLASGDCLGPPNATWTCTSNAGNAAVIVASFVAPSTMRPIGQRSILEFGFSGTSVPAWWRIGTGGCRNSNAVAVSFAPAPSCTDYFGRFSGGVNGSYEYLFGPLEPGEERGGTLPFDQARLIVWSSVDSAQAASVEPLVPGDEAFLFSVAIKRLLTTGTGACAGCVTPACVFLRSVELFLPAPESSHWESYASGSGPLLLQGGPWYCSVPTTRSTWGQVKSLYR